MEPFWLGLPLGAWVLIGGQILLNVLFIFHVRMARSLSWQIKMMDMILSRMATSRGGFCSFEYSKNDADSPG